MTTKQQTTDPVIEALVGETLVLILSRARAALPEDRQFDFLIRLSERIGELNPESPGVRS